MDLCGALGHRISAIQTQFVVVIRLQIDDEILHLRQIQRYGESTVLQVCSGAEGTTATSHAEGAEIVALPAFALFFHPLSWDLVAAVALADIGIASIGTLLAAIAAASRARRRPAAAARACAGKWP